MLSKDLKEINSICNSLWLNSEKAMAPHSTILAWEIPCTEEPGWLQSVGWQRVGHSLVPKQQQLTLVGQASV